MNQIRLGVLDMGRLENNESVESTLQRTIKLAAYADSLGFFRYWLTEHHNPGVAWGGPEPLLAVLASNTKKIKIGAAGILLSYHNPIKVFDDFKLMNCLFPGRIELGLANGIPEINAEALSRLKGSNKNANFEKNLQELLSYSKSKVSSPPIWLLGKNSFNLGLAKKNHISYCHSLFHSSGSRPKEVLVENLLKLNRLKADLTSRRPNSLCIAIAGICARSRKEASETKTLVSNDVFSENIRGTPEDWITFLTRLRSKFKCNDFVFLDMAADYTNRKRTLRLLSDAFNLGK